MSQPKQRYEVIISGGGIAGATLALMFEKLGITYFLLEARDTLKPERGAGIGLQPNGLRILDQLGLMDDIESATVPLDTWFSYDAEGNLMATSGFIGQFRDRMGYPYVFIERSKLLPILTRRIRRLDCVKTSARVASIEETDDHVVVTTSDGFSVTGDIVVGAEGIHSIVRKHIDSSLSGERVLSADNYMKICFSNVYGMSAPTKGIAPGDRFAVYREPVAVSGFTGQGGVIFWSVLEDLQQCIPLSRAPRYNEADTEALCKDVEDVQVTPRLKFGDIYENRVTGFKMPIEEGIAEEWHTDRAVIVGDAACKTHPAGGQGANHAIESCAVLVNKLMEARKAAGHGKKLSREAIRSALSSYAQTRAQPASMILERSKMLGRAIICGPGKISTSVKDMLNLSDEDALPLAIMTLANAPVLEGVGLTARGRLYNQTVKATQAEANRRMDAARAVAAVETGEY
ncbi:FAD-dependent monooxygenase [Ustulina deusta]|nr:FAD-dependent monooxygenase [Ustulina deusta]